ncbi:hypothetical protein DYBT9275_03080 [Dyadobacter sp. CECT 9275]|uniref:Uncharacterized protein n=1 Tax=Dyadobacter helix TaxID=2822344 RepID=A0A916JCL9_9BACT|nr:hypothetical protein [Dyadobacter sp. CECT 9275]CAG5003165.1 hypothetical protein DYBT9275_03080 [Dyadobacter sp. CECT 9275]
MTGSLGWGIFVIKLYASTRANVVWAEIVDGSGEAVLPASVNLGFWDLERGILVNESNKITGIDVYRNALILAWVMKDIAEAVFRIILVFKQYSVCNHLSIKSLVAYLEVGT